MPKNVKIPRVPDAIRHDWLKMAARKEGCSFKQWSARFGEAARQFGLIHCVYRTWMRQLVRIERVARMTGRGCMTRMRASPTRL